MSAQRGVRPLRAIPQHGPAAVTAVSANFATGCAGALRLVAVAAFEGGLEVGE